MKKLLLVFVPLVVIVSAIILILNVNKNNNDRQQQKKVPLTVGMSFNYYPFAYLDDIGNKVGFDLELINKIAEMTDYEVIIKEAKFKALFHLLESEEIDIVISGLAIDNSEARMVDFSDSYCYTHPVLVSMGDVEIDIGNAFEDKKVGVVLGSDYVDIANTLGDAVVVTFENIDDELKALSDGEIDIVVDDMLTLKHFITINEGSNLKILDYPLTDEDVLIGLAAKKKNFKLLNKINVALKQLKENGEYDVLYNKWFEDIKK